MLRKREETEYADCGCGCGKYAEPPRSCKVCEFAEGDSGYEVGLTCGLLNTKVGVYHYADKPCVPRGKRSDCPIRKRHSEGLHYE